MKNYQILPIFFYRWYRFQFLCLIFLNVFFGIFFTYFSEFSNLSQLVLIILFFISLNFYFSTSLISKNHNAEKGFSLNYLRSLPLSPEEFLFNFSLFVLFKSFPLFVLLMFNSWGDLSDLKSNTFLVILCLLFETEDLLWKFRYPDNGYFEQKKKQEIFLYSVKQVIVFSSLLLLLFFLDITDEVKPIIALIVDIPLVGIAWLWQSWYIGPVLLAGYVGYFQLTLRRLRKKDHANKALWVGKRDIPLCAVCMGIICYVIGSRVYGPPNYYKDNPLLVAIHEKDYLQISIFIKNGVNLNSVNKYGFTPLMAAAYKGDWSSYKLLKNSGANKWEKVNSPKDFMHETNLLHLAILGKEERIIKDVLDMGVDPNAEWGKNKVFPIHMASQRCLASSVDKLLQKGAKLEVLDKSSKSALHLAAYYDCPATAMLLLDHGLDANLRDKNKKFARDYIKRSREMIYYFDKKSRAPAGKR